MKTLIFFGGTGNLFVNKIFPALVTMYARGDLENVQVVAIGRRFSSQDAYQNFLLKTLTEKDPALLSEGSIKEFWKCLHYLQGDIEDDSTFVKLNQHLAACCTEAIFYLSTLPNLYQSALRQIKSFFPETLLKNAKVALEKPFGNNLPSFQKLKQTLQQTFLERNIFYVDHYLGKEIVLNLIILKAENWFLERLLSREFVKEVHIGLCEREGVAERKVFYEQTGAIKDVLQNHLLQLLALIAVDAPPLCETDPRECASFLEALAYEKSKLLSKIHLPPPEHIKLGQYTSYREETGYLNSTTETLFVVPLFVATSRWKGVPFYLISGKKMAEKRSFIKVIFSSHLDYTNALYMEIQPEERIDLYLRLKRPGTTLSAMDTRLNFSYAGNFKGASSQAYQKIILDILSGDRALFPDSSFIENAWRLTDQLKTLLDEHRHPLFFYPDYTLTAESLLTERRSENAIP
jgi:glucose-6-phosphate 1-dehydrogenase